MRPAGLARGVSAYVAAWLGAAMIAMLTGATGVVILLAVGLVAGVAAAARRPDRTAPRAGARGEHRHRRDQPATSWCGWCSATAPRPVHAVVAVDGVEVARGWLADGAHRCSSAPHPAAACTTPRHRHLVDRRHGSGCSGGGGEATLEFAAARRRPGAGGRAGPGGPSASDDDRRRRGDERPGRSRRGRRRAASGATATRSTAVHWPSTLRVGEFVVRHLNATTTSSGWCRRAAAPATPMPRPLGSDGRSTTACRGAPARPCGSTTDPPSRLPSAAAVVQWCAAFEPVGAAPARDPFWRRDLIGRPGPEPDQRSNRRPLGGGRRGDAPMAMLLQPLGYGPFHVARGRRRVGRRRAGHHPHRRRRTGEAATARPARRHRGGSGAGRRQRRSPR